MDAQGRGRADDIDPADQWVLNPETGEYELRLTPSAPQSPVPGPRRAGSRRAGAPGTSGASGTSRASAPADGRGPAGAAGRRGAHGCQRGRGVAVS
ncbi:LCP family protein, partial [Streptomyces seoulensis]